MKKILVVDDTTDLMELLVCIMEMAGHEALGISNGLKAIETGSACRPDLILLDVMLGNCDGRDICNTLKADISFANIPIIMVSASHDIGSMDEKNACQMFLFPSLPYRRADRKGELVTGTRQLMLSCYLFGMEARSER